MRLLRSDPSPHDSASLPSATSGRLRQFHGPAVGAWRAGVLVASLTALFSVALLMVLPASGMSPGLLAARPTGLVIVSKVTPVDPAKFAAGACIRYPPLVGNRHLTVFLDAGHGGIDPGAIGETESGATVEEADLTLPVELDTAALLRDKGFTVVVSRTRATTVIKLNPVEESGGVLTLQGVHDDVEARDVCANMAKADALVGIYFDSGEWDDNAGSVTGYDADRPFSAANLRLATLVQNDTLAAMNAQGWQIPDEGVLPDTELGSSVPTDSTGGLAALAENYDHLLLLGPGEAAYQTTPSGMPGALIEPLFISDPFEGSVAASGSGQRIIAQGIAAGIEQFFVPAWSNHPSTTPHELRAVQRVRSFAPRRTSRHPRSPKLA